MIRYRAPEVLLQSYIYSSKVGKCLMLSIDNLFLATMMMSTVLPFYLLILFFSSRHVGNGCYNG